MKAKKIINFLVCAAILVSMIGMIASTPAAGTSSAAALPAVSGVVSMQDFEGGLTDARYTGTTEFTTVDRAEGGKWLKITEAKAYAFYVDYDGAAQLGKAWDGYSFYLKTNGAVSITPHLDHHYSINADPNSDKLYVPSGSVTLVDSNRNKSVLSVGAGGVIDVAEAFEGWVVIPKSGLVDAWNAGGDVNEVPAGSVGSVMLAIGSLGPDVVVNIDDLAWFVGGIAMQDFEGELTDARYTGTTEFTTVDRAEGGKWLKITEAKAYAFYVDYDAAAPLGKAWDGYTFYLKTNGAVSITPHLDHHYAINADPNSDKLYVPSGSVTLIDSNSNKSVLAVGAGGVIDVAEAFEGWVVIPKSGLVDAWNAGGDVNEVPAGSVGSVMLAIGSLGPDVVLNIDDLYWLGDVNAFITDATVSAGAPITITAQPKDVVKEVGETAAFSVTADADGGEITYQWQRSSDKGATWTNIEGATAATCTTGALTAEDHLTQYRCVMLVAATNMRKTTDAATLYVGQYPDVTIDYEIGSDPIAASVFADAKGKNVNLIIKVMNGGELAYTWTINGKDITDAAAFNPEIELLELADIGLDESAPDAVYFKTKGTIPGKAALTVDTSFNFFEAEDLWFYQVGADGKLVLAADGLVAGVSTSTVTLSKAGSYVLNNAEIAGASAGEKPVSSKETPVPDTGSNGFAGPMVLVLFSLAAASIVVFRKQVKAK